MISIDLAGQLRDAGLAWQPAEQDRFVLPGHDLDEQVFVISALPALVQQYNGYPVVTFLASAEWALDFVMLSEALWIPSETQLREALSSRLASGAFLQLQRSAAGYNCQIEVSGLVQRYSAAVAEDAYALALLALLNGHTSSHQ